MGGLGGGGGVVRVQLTRHMMEIQYSRKETAQKVNGVKVTEQTILSAIMDQSGDQVQSAWDYERQVLLE